MENKTKPTVSLSQFKADVAAGMTKAELVTKWGISPASVKQIAAKFELTIQRAVAPKYILVDDESEETTTSDSISHTELTFESLVSDTALNN